MLINIRDYQPKDCPALVALMQQAIAAVDEQYYSWSQKQAWAAILSDCHQEQQQICWQRRFAGAQPLVATSTTRTPIAFI